MGISREAALTGLPYLHILTLETIMLRVGLACGFIKPMGGASGEQKAN